MVASKGKSMAHISTVRPIIRDRVNMSDHSIGQRMPPKVTSQAHTHAAGERVSEQSAGYDDFSRLGK